MHASLSQPREAPRKEARGGALPVSVCLRLERRLSFFFMIWLALARMSSMGTRSLLFQSEGGSTMEAFRNSLMAESSWPREWAR